MSMRCRPTGETFARILDGEADPSMMGRAPVTAASPLSGDVLRAYDNYNSELIQASGV